MPGSDSHQTNVAIMATLTTAVELTEITKWEILPNLRVMRVTGTGDDGGTWVATFPLTAMDRN